MILFPKAKINIGLYITEKRNDGFHNLQTVFYPVSLCDALEFVAPPGKMTGDEFSSSGIDIDCPPEKNLVMKALLKLREFKHLPFMRIHLHKAIPFGAGLGGGSSDAATFIKGLNKHFGLGMSNEELKEIALTIGSDCPFFIDGNPAYAEGRGEITTPVDPVISGKHIVIIKPDIDISTKEAYQECVPLKRPPDLKDHFNLEITRWKDLIGNDFEKSLFLKYPQLAIIKKSLYDAGALYSSMSGSGSSIYGIFNEKPNLPGSLRQFIIYNGVL